MGILRLVEAAAPGNPGAGTEEGLAGPGSRLEGCDSPWRKAEPLWRCDQLPTMEITRARTKNPPAKYLVILVNTVPDPAPKSASVAAPPKAKPAPASFFGSCMRTR